MLAEVGGTIQFRIYNIEEQAEAPVREGGRRAVPRSCYKIHP